MGDSLWLWGTEITVCLNGQALSTVNDPMLKSGRVGVVAGAYDEPVQIHFDNFGVWKSDYVATDCSGAKLWEVSRLSA